MNDVGKATEEANINIGLGQLPIMLCFIFIHCKTQSCEPDVRLTHLTLQFFGVVSHHRFIVSIL